MKMTNKKHSYGIKYNILLTALLMCFVFEAFSQASLYPISVTEEIIDGEKYTTIEFNNGSIDVLYEDEDGYIYTIYEVEDESNSLTRIDDTEYLRSIYEARDGYILYSSVTLPQYDDDEEIFLNGYLI